MSGILSAAAGPMLVLLAMVVVLAVAHFTGLFARVRESKPEMLTATFIGAVLFGFVIAFGGAGAAEGDGEFTVEGRGTVGGEEITVRVDGASAAVITFTTTTDSYLSTFRREPRGRRSRSSGQMEL